MRGPARGLILAAVLLALATVAHAGSREDLLAICAPSFRELDGEEFLEDEPIWMCIPGLTRPFAQSAAPFGLVTFVDRAGVRHSRHVVLDYGRQPVKEGSEALPSFWRGFDLTQLFGEPSPTGRHALLQDAGTLPAGTWEIRPAFGDTSRVLARFRVVEPPGSERAVRDGLARAARLAEQEPDRAAALYEAIGRRYPRTTFATVIDWGLWNVRAYTRYANAPEKWLEEIFAHFHDSCFGTIALDRFVNDLGEERARPIVRRLVGLYPDTPLSRAASRYL